MASNKPAQTYADAARQAAVPTSAAQTDSSASVPLPSRKAGSTAAGATGKSVWAINNAPDAAAQEQQAAGAAPLTECDKHNRPQAVCCRELRGDDERHLIDPDIVRDIIIGLSDGLTGQCSRGSS